MGDYNHLSFAEFSSKFGYVKARQYKKQIVVKENLKIINKAEVVTRDSKKGFRLNEVILISKTAGEPSLEGAVEKVISITDKGPDVLPGYSEKDAEDKFYTDIAIKTAMKDPKREYVCSQMGLNHLPFGFGDTLFLQTGFVNNISCTLNNLQALVTQKIPQLSMQHFRYIRSMNLMGNKLNKLPADIGSLHMLIELNVSQNNLSSLPPSISQLTSLSKLDLSRNYYSNLENELSKVPYLTHLDLSSNSFASIPSPVVQIRRLRYLDMSRNSISHMAILIPLLKPMDLWMKMMDAQSGKYVYMNILTREKVKHPEEYTGAGILKATDLHVFQRAGTRSYRRRKMWLSINQIYEWEAVVDDSTGMIYFRNNVSGETSWDTPSELDTMGQLEFLEELYINNNVIKTCCQSLDKLTSIKKLVMHSNRFSALPDGIGNLKQLESFDLHGCELKLFPPSLCDCSSLVDLNAQGNQLIRLPDLLGTLPKLKNLDVTANRMTQLPFSLGYCKSLELLFASENPLIDPPAEELGNGLPQLLWYLRQRLMIDDRGMPPVMQYHNISVLHEVTILKPELTDRIQYLINLSLTSGFINFQLFGLQAIPTELLRLKKLKKLRFDFNDKLTIPSMPRQLSMLKLLSLRCCKMKELPEDINNIFRITTLLLQDNLFERLPISFIKLRSLVVLDLGRNRLYSLPPGMSQCSNLRNLNLESNNLDSLPSEIGNLSGLLTLNVSRNRISDFPESLCKLSYLKTLNFEANKLLFVPKKISYMNIINLRLGHNSIEYLNDDIFDYSLGVSCTMFSIAENNLLQLPFSISKLDPDSRVEFEFNPFKSPPQYLLSETLVVIQHYLRIRAMRLEELCALLEKEDFTVDRNAIFPVACDIVIDGSGYLNPDDLAEFDQAVDEYVNGEYYNCPASCTEIVTSIAKLREFRETEIYLTILHTTNAVLTKLAKKKDKRFGESVLMTSKRAYGKKGEDVNVWVVSLQALLRETLPNKAVKKGRPALISLISEALPEMPFPFSIELLKDALRLYQSPYGQIADTEQVAFGKCDCVSDDKKGKPLKHKICTKAAITLCKCVYTEEEAERRDIEEDEYLKKFEEIESEIKLWLLTDEGRKAMTAELKSRNLSIDEDIDIRDELCMAEEAMLMKHKRAFQRNEEKRHQFEAGEPFDVHGYHTLDEAMAEYNASDEAVKTSEVRLGTLKKQMEDLIAVKALSYKKKLARAADDLIRKYCCEMYTFTIKRFRQFASQNGNRKRHWDGEDGDLYVAWLKKFGNISNNLIKKADLVGSDYLPLCDRAMMEYDVKRELEKKDVEDKGEIFIDYNWEGCADMSKYDIPLFSKYMNSKLSAILANAGKAFTAFVSKAFT